MIIFLIMVNYNPFLIDNYKNFIKVKQKSKS